MWCENLDLVLLPTRQARTQKMPWLLPEILNLIYEASMAKLQGQFHKDIIVWWSQFWRKFLFFMLLNFLKVEFCTVWLFDRKFRGFNSIKNAPSEIVLTHCGIEKKQYVLKFVEENEFFYCTQTHGFRLE